MVSEDNLSTKALRMNKVVFRYHEGKLCKLDHESVVPNIVSL